MYSPQFRYAEILQAVEETPDVAEVAVIATTLGSGHDPNIGPWFHDAVRSRYREFTRPGLPDGPGDQRLHLFR